MGPINVVHVIKYMRYEKRYSRELLIELSLAEILIASKCHFLLSTYVHVSLKDVVII